MQKRANEFTRYVRERELAFMAALLCLGRRLKHERGGQGTTEYAILVGVLVVIAIIAVIAFRDNLESLWSQISEAINGL